MQDTVLLCRSLKTSHQSCCCTHRLQLPALGDELASAPCCDAATREATAIPPSSGAAPDFHLAAPVRVADALFASAPLRVTGTLPVADEGVTALATGPPLHLLHHALLI